MKGTPFDFKYLVSLYDRSLACNDYFLEGHPDFETCARGMLAFDYIAASAPPQLIRDYPPRPLPGLEPAGYFTVPQRARRYHRTTRR
jgi:hypothetical protein